MPRPQPLHCNRLMFLQVPPYPEVFRDSLHTYKLNEQDTDVRAAPLSAPTTSSASWGCGPSCISPCPLTKKAPCHSVGLSTLYSLPPSVCASLCSAPSPCGKG